MNCRLVSTTCLCVETFLPPANEVWGNVIFLHLSVILFTGGGSTWAGTPPRQVHPPGRYTPLPGQVHPLGRYNPPAGTPWGGKLPWAGTPPQAGTSPGRYTPGQVHTPPWTGTLPPGALHAGRYGQQAGGTHPTGMHSCNLLCLFYR